MNAIKTYFVDVLKHHYCDFKGRATRTQYWLFVLFTIVLLLPVNLILFFTVPQLMALLNLALFTPNLAIITRRLRDGGFSPWLVLLGIPGQLFSLTQFFISWNIGLYALAMLGNFAIFIFMVLPSKK